MARTLKIRQEKRVEEARACLQRIEEFKRTSGFGTWIEKMAHFDRQWRGKLDRFHPPWAHASEYNPLITWSKVEDVHAVIYGFLSTFGFFALAPSSTQGGMAEEMLRQRGEKMTALQRWSLTNESNAQAFLDRFCHDGLLYGHAFGGLDYVREVRKITAEFFLDSEMRNAVDMDDRALLTAGIGDALIGKPTKRDDGTFDIEFEDADGEEKDGIAWIERRPVNRSESEVAIMIQREAVIRDCPVPRNITIGNMLVPPSVKSLQSARRYWERRHLTFEEIDALYRSGVFNTMTSEELRDLRTRAYGPNPEVSGSSVGTEDAVQSSRDEDLGSTYLSSRGEMFETFWEYAYEDTDGDGHAESIIRIVLNWNRPMLLGRQFLEALYPHGRRPHFDWMFQPIDGRYYGMGVAEVLEGTQREGNAFYQARQDVLEIITKPAALFDPLSGLTPSMLRLTPGLLIKARDPARALAPISFPIDPTSLLREQSGMEAEAERGIGSTDLGLGRSPSRPNAPRTLGGTAIIVRQQQLRMDVYLKRLMLGPSAECTGGVVEFLHQYRELLVAFMGSQKEFRVMGTDEVMVAQREDLQGRYDYVIDFSDEINNPQLKLQNTVLRYQNSITNPLVMADPEALYWLTVDLWEATGKKNAARLLRKPTGQDAHPPMTQEEENAVMSKGIYVDVLMSDNHEEHLADIAQLLQGDPLQMASLFGPEGIKMLNRHAEKHMQMMTAGQAAAGGAMLGGGGNGRGPRVQMSMSPYGASGMSPQEPMAGPVEMETETGITP